MKSTFDYSILYNDETTHDYIPQRQTAKGNTLTI